MTRYLRSAALICGLLALISITPRAQMRVVPLDDTRGHVALGMALRHLANTGIFMQTTAHPDDENNALLVMLNRGQGYRTALATATRGNGGQNEIGPEIFEALGVLRTQELAALHRFDGAEQYFTRAVDFGYSFSIEETFEKWGREEITADYVRLIRTVRPDVVIALPPTGNAGGQHHMASAVITRDAYKLAGDPTRFPEQIRDGLRPWQPKKLYELTAFGFPGEAQPTGPLTRVSTAIYDPLLGKTYAEIGSEARSMHKCQGMGQLLALPGPSASAYRLAESAIPAQADEKSLFAGLDTSIASLARFAGDTPPRELAAGLASVTAAVQAAQHAFDTQTDQATLEPLLAGLHAVHAVRAALGGLTIDDPARYEIDFRLRQKEQEFQEAALLANGVTVDAIADDGVVVPGQPVKVNVIVANHGAAEVTVKQVKFNGFDRDAACTMTPFTPGFGFPGGGRGRAAAPAGPPMTSIQQDQVGHCEPTLTIPADARLTTPYWHRKDYGGRYTFDADAPFGLPYRPTPFHLHMVMTIVGPSGVEEITAALPATFRYGGDIFSGEKRTELLVVPAFSVRVSPETAIVPASAVRAGSTASADKPASAARMSTASAGAPGAAQREIRVTVVNDAPGPAEGVVTLELPRGWTGAPAQQGVKMVRADEAQTVRFMVKPAASTPIGEYHLRAVVTSGSRSFDRGFQVVEYPHITRHHIISPAEATLKVIDVKTAPRLLVGYVMGVGDDVPAAIEQLGARVEMITPDMLAWGNLARFNVIVTGVRAYERRDDLRANNARLLDYVRNGGTMIVQYNKFEFNEAQYGPYPAQVSSNRVTDENAPISLKDPENKVFTQPNRIRPAAWDGWVQERGLYFLGEKDPRYKDLVELADPFEKNKGMKAGALVEADYGKGKWLYVGLNFWRQLPGGTVGAYQLFGNLLSLGKPATAVVPAITSGQPK